MKPTDPDDGRGSLTCMTYPVSTRITSMTRWNRVTHVQPSGRGRDHLHPTRMHRSPTPFLPPRKCSPNLSGCGRWGRFAKSTNTIPSAGSGDRSRCSPNGASWNITSRMTLIPRPDRVLVSMPEKLVGSDSSFRSRLIRPVLPATMPLAARRASSLQMDLQRPSLLWEPGRFSGR